MSKAIVRVGYSEYVMSMADAVTIMEIMSKAENYKVNRNYDATPNTTSFHVWEQEVDHDQMNIQLLPDAVYRVAKLAGKPIK